MIKHYALVAEGDVFLTLAFDDDIPVAAKWIAALDSNVKFIKMNHYAQCRPGFFFDGVNLYDSEDDKMLNPLPQMEMELGEEKNQYAGIIDNEVVGMYTIQKADNPNGNYEMLDAGFQSNPEIVDITDNPLREKIIAGWQWDGKTFYSLDEE